MSVGRESERERESESEHTFRRSILDGETEGEGRGVGEGERERETLRGRVLSLSSMPHQKSVYCIWQHFSQQRFSPSSLFI